MSDKYVRCITCCGSGKVMGGGMIIRDCDDCDGNGRKFKDEEDFDEFNVKSTESYQNAIQTIQEKCKVDKNTAKEMFDHEIKNQAKGKRKA